MSRISRAASSVRADCQRLAGDAFGATEVAGRRGDRGRVERHAPHTISGTRAGLVEGDVSIASEPEHRQVNGRGIEDRLVANRLSLGVERGAVEGFAPADAEAGELAVERRAETARVVLPEAQVLIQAEHGHTIRGQRAVGGVVAQRRIEPNRRMPCRQQHAHVSTRADTVGDQFGRGQADVTMIVEDQQRRRRHAGSVARRYHPSSAAMPPASAKTPAAAPSTGTRHASILRQRSTIRSVRRGSWPTLSPSKATSSLRNIRRAPRVGPVLRRRHAVPGSLVWAPVSVPVGWVRAARGAAADDAGPRAWRHTAQAASATSSSRI
jgi:hypothetical protein